MRPRAALLWLAALASYGPSVSAQTGLSFNRTGSGARAAGMANAFIAVSDDGTAASWNPAGLGQLRKPELSIVSSTIDRILAAEGFRTRDDLAAFTPLRSSYQSTYLDFASLAVPVTLWGKPVTFQGSWRRLYTLDFREVASTTREPLVPEGPPPLRIDSNEDLVGSVNIVSLAGAVKLTPRLALGGSFNFWRGDWSDDATVSETPLTNGGESAFLTNNQTNRVRGNSFSLGLMLTYPRWNVGVVHQGALTSDYTNRTTLITSGAPAIPTLTFDSKLRFPQALGLGGAWHPAARWTVALDLTWDDWSDAVIDSPEMGRVNFLDGLPADRTSTKDTISVNAGAEHLFFGDGFVIPLRFGAAWEPQGGRDPYTRDPVNFVMLAMGTGYNTNSLKFDAAFQYRWAHFRSGGSFGLARPMPEQPTAVGDRDSKEWRLKLSVILRVTDTDKLRRGIRKVFGGG
jgi:long-subunit fatty acid transport protein